MDSGLTTVLTTTGFPTPPPTPQVNSYCAWWHRRPVPTNQKVGDANPFARSTSQNPKDLRHRHIIDGGRTQWRERTGIPPASASFTMTACRLHGPTARSVVLISRGRRRAYASGMRLVESEKHSDDDNPDDRDDSGSLNYHCYGRTTSLWCLVLVRARSWQCGVVLPSATMRSARRGAVGSRFASPHAVRRSLTSPRQSPALFGGVFRCARSEYHCLTPRIIRRPQIPFSQMGRSHNPLVAGSSPARPTSALYDLG
jgi:hypothetical protein